MKVVTPKLWECVKEKGQESMEIPRCVVCVIDCLTKVGIREPSAKSTGRMGIFTGVSIKKKKYELTNG